MDLTFCSSDALVNSLDARDVSVSTPGVVIPLRRTASNLQPSARRSGSALQSMSSIHMALNTSQVAIPVLAWKRCNVDPLFSCLLVMFSEVFSMCTYPTPLTRHLCLTERL